MVYKEMSVEALKHYYRGRVYEATGELDIAIEEYKKAIEYGADYADVHNSLGRVLAKRGFLEEAKIEFETALRINPKYLEAQKNLNELLLKINILKQQSTVELPKTPPPINVNTTPPPPPPQTSFHEKTTTELFIPPPPKIQITKKTKILVIKIAVAFLSFILVSLLSTTLYFQYKNFVLKSYAEQKIFSVGSETLSSINRYKDKLVLSSWSTQEILFYRVLQDTLYIVSKLKLDNIVPTSIHFIGNNLFVLDGWNKKIYRYILTDAKLVFIKIVDVSDTIPLGLASYKNLLLLLDTKGQKIIIYDADLKKIDTIPLVVKNPIGITSYKNKVWIIDKDAILYEMNKYNEIKNSYKLDFLSSKIISSIFIDNKFIWIADEVSSNIYRYKISVLKKAKI